MLQLQFTLLFCRSNCLYHLCLRHLFLPPDRECIKVWKGQPIRMGWQCQNQNPTTHWRKHGHIALGPNRRVHGLKDDHHYHYYCLLLLKMRKAKYFLFQQRPHSDLMSWRNKCLLIVFAILQILLICYHLEDFAI